MAHNTLRSDVRHLAALAGAFAAHPAVQRNAVLAALASQVGDRDYATQNARGAAFNDTSGLSRYFASVRRSQQEE